MARYRYECSVCKQIEQKYANSDKITNKCSACGGISNRLSPTISKATVNELVDSYSAVRLSPDHKDDINQRSLDYFWSVEVPRLCGEYSPEECLHQGWAYMSEKGEFCVHTKPPNRR
jgi:hypothetical protein